MFQRIRNVLFVNKAAAWTAAFTFVLTVFTFLLYRVADSTNDTQRISQRAFLTYSGSQNGPRIVENSADPNSRWIGQEIDSIWTNAGNTPARDVVVQSGYQSFFPDLPDPYDFPLTSPKTHMALGPKGIYGTVVVVEKEVLSDAVHGKKRVFIWGTAIYKDTFPSSPERLSEFCIRLDHLTVATPSKTPTGGSQSGKQATPTPTATTSLDLDAPGAAFTGFSSEQCQAHNCYDRDCKDYPDRIKDMRK